MPRLGFLWRGPSPLPAGPPALHPVRDGSHGCHALPCLGGAYALGRSGGSEIPPIDARATGVQASAQPGNAQPSHGSRIEALKCEGCAVVLDVYTERHAGQASSLGAVAVRWWAACLAAPSARAMAKLATVGGAVAGGYAGHGSKRRRATTVWVVRVADARPPAALLRGATPTRACVPGITWSCGTASCAGVNRPRPQTILST